MKVNYDAKTDTLTVIFRDVPVAESDEASRGKDMPDRDRLALRFELFKARAETEPSLPGSPATPAAASPAYRSA